jgi:hypothetical protein
MNDDDQPIFLPTATWRRLSDWLAEHEDLAQQLGIMPSAFTGTITECETTAFLGGMCDVWPTTAKSTILAGMIEETA